MVYLDAVLDLFQVHDSANNRVFDFRHIIDQFYVGVDDPVPVLEERRQMPDA